ncbi:chitobiase/beta-hexosaminidase C-terminal domain-containing protein [Priestia megaterium]|uniref:chitobiase/beta-hexosaminidase C-terminal domain-containing protein n=1 Tax=Priestia megaterium TaxID=1404 RepID=UPI002E1CFA69|nr:chitobiase/beta-hexosaminidase C-terminal domain-containing protein [Priestia megaterium]MED4255744.1 chitobiase/beta-hexosaminidase C-terminal domain-containing protein [Priestia megaterium]
MNNTSIQKVLSFITVGVLILAFLPLNIVAAKEENNYRNVKKPTSSVLSGTYYLEQKVELKTNTPGAKTYYTLDGSTPTTKSTQYTNPIIINNDTVLKAISIRGNAKNKNHSDLAIFTYSFESRESIATQFLSFTYKTMPYRLYVPKDYDSKKSYPLVLFLHGGGERGNDNKKQLLSNDGAIVWASPENQRKHPAFVLAPQARNVPSGGFTVTRDDNNKVDLAKVFETSEDLKTAYEILQSVRKAYNIDSNRLYSTGLSQGGFGTFNLNIEHPNLFAAMVPIAGGADLAKAHLLTHKTIWAFHAEDDSIIPVAYSRNIIEAIKKAGGHPLYTEYPKELKYDHASWVPAYQNQKMIDWLFQQVKQANQ